MQKSATHPQRRRRYLLTASFPVGADSMAPDEAQARAIEACGHPGAAVLVVGGAGSGKTTTLAHAVVSRVRSGEKLGELVVLTHSRPAAQQLRAQVMAGVGRSQLSPRVTTMHGLCRQLMARYGQDWFENGEPPRLLTAPEQEVRVRELLRGFDTSAWPADVRQAAGTRAFAGEVRAVLARARQLGMDPADVARAGAAANRPEWVAVANFLDEYLDVLDAEGVIDYTELVHRTRLLLREPGVAASVPTTVRAVYCDEFSELDSGQVGVLADLHRLGVTVACFADPLTAVYAFRGAQRRNVLDFERTFALTGAEPQRIDLTGQYRLPLPLWRATARVASRLPLDGAAQVPDVSVAPGRHGGQLLVAEFDSAGDEVAHVAEYLRRAHLDEGWGWAEMAVVSRSGGGELARVGRALGAVGVPVDLAGDDLALADEVAVRPLLDAAEAVLTLAHGAELGGEQALRLLCSPLGTTDVLTIRRAGKQLRLLAQQESGQDQSSDDLLAQAITHGVWPQATAASSSPAAEGLDVVAQLGALLRAGAGAVAEGAPAAEVLWRLWSGTAWPPRLRAEALGWGEGSARASRDLDAVCALFDTVNRSGDLVGAKGLRQLLAEIRAQAIAADTARESDPRGAGVQVLTAHRTKGRQWRLVVVLGVQEGTWPSLRRPDTLLEADRLSVDGVGEPEPISAQVARERRLFLLACSRASERLLVTASRGVEGEADQPSRFLNELGAPVRREHGRPRRPRTLPALVAELRRFSVDQGCSPGLRDAAAVQLAALGQVRNRAGRQLVRAAIPANWWGVGPVSQGPSPVAKLGEPVSLSGSAVQTLLECPRRWFMARQARADTVRSASQGLGSVIHAMVQHAQQHGLGREDLHVELERVWGDIPFEAEWLSASQRVEAEAALERFLRWCAIRCDEVVGVEVPFEVTIRVAGDSVRVRGSIDRLERDADGRLRVVDFKTGRSAPSTKDVAGHDQLGVYQLAARLGAFDHLVPGERRLADAELVHLRVDKDGLPKAIAQESLDVRPHLALEADSSAETWVHDHLATAARIVRSEQFVAVACNGCRWCPFGSGCPNQASVVGGKP